MNRIFIINKNVTVYTDKMLYLDYWVNQKLN